MLEMEPFMIIAAEYSFNGGHSIQKMHPYLLQEVEDIIAVVDASHYKIKESKLTMPGKKLYSPSALNFAQGFGAKGWQKKRVTCNYSTEYYRPGYSSKQMRPAYREMDFLKDRLGIEVQFGKYAMPGKMLYSPPDLNRAFAQGFGSKGWKKKRVTCHYSTAYYQHGNRNTYL